jgi:hypothetical protein
MKGAIALWPDFAERCEVPQPMASEIAAALKTP